MTFSYNNNNNNNNNNYTTLTTNRRENLQNTTLKTTKLHTGQNCIDKKNYTVTQKHVITATR